MRCVQAIFVVTLVAFAQCQLSAVPVCSLSCLTAAIEASGCSSTDSTCICVSQADKIQSSLTPCLLQSCPAADLLVFQTALSNFCASASGTAIATATAVIPSTLPTVLSSPPSAVTASASVSQVSSAASLPPIPTAISSTLALSTPKSTISSASSESSNAPPVSTAVGNTNPQSTSTITPQATGGSDLSPGAKAGIGVGVAIIAILGLLSIALCLQHRRKQQRYTSHHSPEIPPAHGHEMITSANAHEMDGKNAGAMIFGEKKIHPEERVAELSTPVADKKPATEAAKDERPPLPELNSQNEKPGSGPEGGATAELQAHDNSNAYEMPALATATNVGSDWEHLGASELDSEPAAGDESLLHAHPHPTPQPSAEQPIALPAATGLFAAAAPQSGSGAEKNIGSESKDVNGPPGVMGHGKLDILRQRIDRVREDKERLEKIQQLKDLEAELQREIMAEQRKMAGAGEA